MAISYVGGMVAPSVPGFYLPAHEVDDVIVEWAMCNTGNRVLPADMPGFTRSFQDDSPFNDGGTIYDTATWSLSYMVSSTGSVYIDSFPDDSDRIYEIYRDVDITFPFGNPARIFLAPRTAFLFQLQSFGVSDGTSWVIKATTAIDAFTADLSPPPSNLVLRHQKVGVNGLYVYDSNQGISAYPNTNGPLFPDGSHFVRGGTAELRERKGVRLVQTLEPVSFESIAEITDPPPPIVAEMEATLDDVILDSEATIPQVIKATLNAMLDDVVLDSTVDITLPEIQAALSATLNDVKLTSKAAGGLEATLVQTLEDVTLKSKTQSLGIDASLVAILDDVRLEAVARDEGARLVAILDDVQLEATAMIKPVGAHLTATLEDVVLRSEATITQPQTWYHMTDCCTPSLCSIDPCTLICNFVNILPSGPLWDREKARVLAKYGTGTVCIDEPRQIGSCASVVDHAVYTALKFYDVLRNGLYPAIRESNPLTAHDTMDDWLERLNWQSCVDNACQMPAVNGLLPIQMQGPCGTCIFELEYEECLVHYLKHATIVALTRLQFGGIKNLCFINNVIEPLGAVVFPTVGSDENCAAYTLAPTREEFPVWHKLDCLPQAGGVCQAYHEPNKGARTPLPDKIFPGLIAAECIVRSMLPQSTCIEFYRMCEVPEIIPSTCFSEM